MPGLANGLQYKKSKKYSRISNGSGANVGRNSQLKALFFKNNPTFQEKIVQYSGRSSFKNMIQSFDHAESKPFPNDRERQKKRSA
jgi:hypothetical protein